MTSDEQADDMAQAVDERLTRLRELAALRTRARRAQRQQLAARRTAGLRQRHAERLARITERTDRP